MHYCLYVVHCMFLAYLPCSHAWCYYSTLFCLDAVLLCFCTFGDVLYLHTLLCIMVPVPLPEGVCCLCAVFHALCVLATCCTLCSAYLSLDVLTDCRLYNLVFAHHCQLLPGSLLGCLSPSHSIKGLGTWTNESRALVLVAKS